MTFQDESPTVLYPLLRPLLQPLTRGAGEASRGGLGPELLVNGDFEAGSANWTVAGEDGTHIVTFIGGTARYQAGTTSPQLILSQPSVGVIGKTYRVEIVVSAFVSGGLRCDFLTGQPVVSSVGAYVFINSAASTVFSVTRSTANTDITLESVSVREVYS